MRPRGGNQNSWGNIRRQPSNTREIEILQDEIEQPTMIIDRVDVPKMYSFVTELGKKGELGKLTLYEVVSSSENLKVPKFKGEIRIGDRVFDVALWKGQAKNNSDVYYSGPIKVKTGGSY
jgi:hypothetical protein